MMLWPAGIESDRIGMKKVILNGISERNKREEKHAKNETLRFNQMRNRLQCGCEASS